jgi:hypothetical protein
MKPTIYLSNWSSHKTPGHHGPGRKLTIMANPRHWERGDGAVSRLRPSMVDVRGARDGRLSLTTYRQRYLARLALDMHGPGHLYAWIPYATSHQLVSDGDTLCCACSRDKAAAGECHRVWAAEALAGAGWRVILDGKELAP